jgi:hypothetical protein
MIFLFYGNMLIKIFLEFDNVSNFKNSPRKWGAAFELRH